MSTNPKSLIASDHGNFKKAILPLLCKCKMQYRLFLSLQILKQCITKLKKKS